MSRNFPRRIYDANGNRATKTAGGVTETYVYDDADKLDEITVGGVTVKDYGYDAAGRTTSVVTGAGTTTLSYDYESQITGITYPNTSTNSFTYNGLDTRVSKTDSGGTKTYRRDGAYVTDPVLTDGTTTFTPGISNRTGTTSKWEHPDHLGSNIRQTAAAETVTSTLRFDAFGNLAAATGTHAGPFGFAGGHGYQADSDSGLMLLGHRYYDSSTGRFLTRDRIKHGRNWYTYCENSPANHVDPTGECMCLAQGGGGAAVTGAPPASVGISISPGLAKVLKVVAAAAALIGITIDVPTETVDNGSRDKSRGRPIYRVVEPAESASLIGSGGIPTPSPTGQEAKPFWTSPTDAMLYQSKVQRWQPAVVTQIWVWPNPQGVG